MMKRTLYILSMLLFMTTSKGFAQCEAPADFAKTWGDLSSNEADALADLSESEADTLQTTTDNIISSLEDVIAAVNKETVTILDSFQKYTLQRMALEDAMNKMAVVRNRQVANARNQTTRRMPDMDDRACAKATNAQNWTNSKIVADEFKKMHKNQFLSAMIDDKDSFWGAETTVENNTNWFSDTAEKNDPSRTPNPFVGADVNANSLFSLPTFVEYDWMPSEDAYPDAIPSTPEMPNTVVAAQQYAKNLVGNKGINAAGNDIIKNKKARAEMFSEVSRKGLAYSVFADIISRRTTLPGSGTGNWLRSFYSGIANGDDSVSTQVARTIAPDISEYELKDHMYSKMYTNPDWITSLETGPKQIQLEQLEIVNKNMSLEWDTLLMLEKLATVDAANLATTIDKSRD